MTHTLSKPWILHQTCSERMESCITWWYMIRSARRRFEPEKELIWPFWCNCCDENPCKTLDSASNLRRALGIMYYMVIHDSKRSAQVWAGIRVDMAVLVKPLWWKPLQNLGFCIKLAPSAWNHVIHGDTWFKAISAGLSQNKSWYGRFGVPFVHTPVLDKTPFFYLSPGKRTIYAK